ncbi:MAG: PHP domain-containing protein, partial [Spirochaetes bacterium]
RHAALAGLRALALTDHDTVGGIEEARFEARLKGLVFIPGVEIEIDFDPGEFHLLGLGIHAENLALQVALASLAAGRRERNEAMVDLLSREGMPIDLDELAIHTPTERIGRPHLAQALVRSGKVKTKQEAFDRFFGKGRPFYLPKECLGLETVLRLIADSGGIAVVAHPYSLYVSKARLASLMDGWKEMGIQGIEAYHPAAKLGQCRILERMARERGFIVTAGSDFHDRQKPICGIGKTSGGIPVADAYFSELQSVLPELESLT